jgi:hypothetical protein
MTINNVHALAGGHPAAQLVLADRSQADSTIAVRAIGRLYPDLEVRPVTNLAEAKRALIGARRATALVASGLDGQTCLETIRWFAARDPALWWPCSRIATSGTGRKRSRPEHLMSAASLNSWSHSCGTNWQHGWKARCQSPTAAGVKVRAGPRILRLSAQPAALVC